MKKEINLLRIIAATVGVIAGVAILVTFAMNYGKITGKGKETTAPLTTAAETIAEATSEPKDYSLTALTLESPTKEELAELEKYTDLQELKISGSFADSSLAALAKCPKLQKLDLSGAGITDISALYDFSQLKELNLDGNDSIKWGDAVKLKKTLSGCKISFSTSWSRAIADYINNFAKENDILPYVSAYVCDMDGNGIPEVAFGSSTSFAPFMLVTYSDGKIVEFTDTEMLGFGGSGSFSTHLAFVKGTSMVFAESYGTSTGTAGGNATALWDVTGGKYALKKAITNYNDGDFTPGYEYDSSIDPDDDSNGLSRQDGDIIDQVRNAASEAVLPNYSNYTFVYYDEVAVDENFVEYLSDNLFESLTIKITEL